MVVQSMLFQRVLLSAAILVGALLVGVAYIAVRGLTNRILRRRFKCVVARGSRRTLIEKFHAQAANKTKGSIE
jgi:hypothetical protein